MNIVFYPRFERGYKRLDPQIPRIAHERIALFEQDPFDRRLRTHELHGTQTVDDAPGRHQQLGLLVEIIVESCSCGLGSMMGGICASGGRRRWVTSAGRGHCVVAEQRWWS
jgi:hypothetical protein